MVGCNCLLRGAKEPMHYGDIAAEIIKQNKRAETKIGATPAALLSTRTPRFSKSRIRANTHCAALSITPSGKARIRRPRKR